MPDVWMLQHSLTSARLYSVEKRSSRLTPHSGLDGRIHHQTGHLRRFGLQTKASLSLAMLHTRSQGTFEACHVFQVNILSLHG
jgi:hypothetical protein